MEAGRIPLIFAAWCALALPGVTSAQERVVQTGTASYYADKFHGRKTANGEVFDMHSLTAAHLTLPFNSLVRVTHLGNKKSVVVRINDAGPFVDDRIIDLSYAAAKRLGMLRQGKAQVRLELIGSADPDNAESSVFYELRMRKTRLKGYAVQLASFADLDNLFRSLDECESKGVKDLHVQIAVVKGVKVHRLVSSGFTTRAQAERYLESLERKGIKGFVFQIR